MEILSAAILAGGYGRRLKKHVAISHKSLLKLPDGNTVISRMMNQLYNNGVKELFVVSFVPSVDDLISEVNVQAKKMNMRLNFVWQDSNREYGTLYALKNIFGRYERNEDLIILEGDVVCSNSVITQLCSTKGTALVVDDSISTDFEAMKAVCSNGKVAFLSKNIINYPEFCGVMRFRKKDRELVSEYSSLVKTEDPFYEDAFNLISSSVKNFPFLQISEKDWIEIDTSEDFDEAVKKMNTW